VILRHRTLKLGERLDERAREHAWFEPPSTAECRRLGAVGVETLIQNLAVFFET
jgi:hypothetical protein